MKKTLLFFFLFSCISNISAQEMSITPNPSSIEEDNLNLENGFIELYNDPLMKNESTQETQYKWIKVVESAPTEWEFSVVDINQSYFPEIDTTPVPLTFSPNQEVTFRVSVIPNGAAGCGTVRMDFSLWGDTEDEIIYSAYYEYKVNNPGECFSSTNETILKEANIYPNPTNDFFTIKTDAPFTKIRIIDTSGKLVKVFSRNDLYDISELEEALYFVEIFNDYEKIGVEKIICH